MLHGLQLKINEILCNKWQYLAQTAHTAPDLSAQTVVVNWVVVVAFDVQILHVKGHG